MDFRITDTFTDSLARLAGDHQKAVKTTALDMQLNPAQPGMSFHKLDRAKDKNFWSVTSLNPASEFLDDPAGKATGLSFFRLQLNSSSAGRSQCKALQETKQIILDPAVDRLLSLKKAERILS